MSCPYCYSNDGINCYSDNGPGCDLNSGYMCATSNGIDLINVTYCYTDD